MAIRNKRIFGLPVVLSLADIPDRQEALINLGLRQDDLEIIRGIAADGFDSEDLQTLSNLNTPIYKTFDRYITDVTRYNDRLAFSAGSDIITRGNLEVVGPILSTAFRYPLLDAIDLTKIELRWGDISTSRVSSWSSIGDSIAYGADVSISGKLSVGKLRTSEIPIQKSFPAEQITHKIKINFNGSTRYFYAMKGIPIRFSGAFRNLDATIELNTSTAPPTAWRIYAPGSTNYQDYQDASSSNTSTLQYRSPSGGSTSLDKVIELYANPANIRYFTLENSNITSLPKTRLLNCERFLFQNNGLVDFPDFKFLIPNVLQLRLNNNRFYNSANSKLRYFSRDLSELIPETIQTLEISGCFTGAILPNILNKFTQLRTFSASRSSLNTTAIFYKTGENPTGAVPNFYGVSSSPLSNGINSTQQIRNIYFTQNQFLVFDSGIQAAVDEVSITGGGNNTGSGYVPGKYTNQSVTPVTGPNTGITIDYNVVSTGQVNPDSVKVNNIGTGGNALGQTYTIPGGTPGSLAEIEVSKLIYTQNIKEQTRLINIYLGENGNLTDTNFSLSCGTTLENLQIQSTKLYFPNLTDFVKLSTVNIQRGSNRGSFYDGWDGTYNGANRPVSDTDRFKLLNCSSLTSFFAAVSDLSGYIPKLIGCPNLVTFDMNTCNNIIAGRPAKRSIQKLFLDGAINTIGTFSITGTTGEFQSNIERVVEDTTPPPGGIAAKFIVTTNSTGDVIGVILDDSSRGSRYTIGHIVTIAGSDLDGDIPSSGNKNVQVTVTSVIDAIEGDPTYPTAANSSQIYTDTGANTVYGEDAEVKITFDNTGAVESYEVIFGGREYQDFEYDGREDEYFTVAGSTLGGGSDLKIKIQQVEPPRLLYNDTFEQNPLLSIIDIRINNANYRGAVEVNSFLPCRNTLRFLRLTAAGRVEGEFPNLNDHPELLDSYSPSQGWTGNIPAYTNSLKMQIIRHSGNNFSGEFFYSNKPSCYQVDFTSNKLTSINPETRLTGLRDLFLGNNLIGSVPGSNTFPDLATICPNVQNVDLYDNRLSLYTKGLETLPKLRVLDLSGNRMESGTVDEVLFALEKNYNAAPRSGVSVNLRGSEMGAPTPYPIVTGVVNSILTNSSVTINSSGDVTDLKDAVVSQSGYVPITKKYTSNLVRYSDGSGPGTGASITWNVTSNYNANVITAINSAGRTQTEDIDPELSGTYTLNDTKSGTVAGSGAQVQIVVSNQGADNPSTITSVTLVNGGTGYLIGENITISLGGITGNTSGGFLEIPISFVKKRVYTSVSWTYTINSGGSNYDPTSGEQMKTTDVIIFEDEDGNQLTGHIKFTINGTTQFTNTAVKTGFGVAEFLRQRGWSVQTN